ncbi:MAG: DUF4258 domain-containing protein [Bacteroidetes bacterium]|nr:DUF4258 domain-containing protein [Bacteroidota bacterium]MBU2584606.1 DUF4258 domain-containing protein [Bacteroidota bacterium]
MTSITPEFICEEILSQNYEISIHADDERINEQLIISQLEFVLTNCEIIEEYPNDPRGESCLVLGFTLENKPIHVVCGKNRSEHLILITVYTPEMPKWKDPYTRNRKD